MSIQKADYEEVLAEYSNVSAAISLLKRYRPYLEMLPSIRRPNESLITIPMPVVRMHRPPSANNPNNISSGSEFKRIPCDIAILMCDPEWKIKTGVEIFIFIHRPDEDFSDLLGRWRNTQVSLSQGYEWQMPLRYRHILSEGSDTIYPLFVLFEETPERIKRGLKGAFLPFVTQHLSKQLETIPTEPETTPPGPTRPSDTASDIANGFEVLEVLNDIQVGSEPERDLEIGRDLEDLL